jgi:hypothetical protein
MKKTLLYLLFLLTSFNFYAQVQDIVHCYGNTSFDLTANKSLLLGNLNPLETTISYHVSMAEANYNTNAISQPTKFISSEPSTTIYARIDNKGAVTTNYFNLIINAPFITTALTPSCYSPNGSYIHITGTGGQTPYMHRMVYNNTDMGPYQENPYFYNLAPGDYTIVSQDKTGCVTTTILVIRNLIQLTATVTVDDRAIIITASGGSQSYRYSLDGTNFQTDKVFLNLSKGTYTVYVKDSNDCVISRANVIINPVIYADNSVTPPTCANPTGTITVRASGGVKPYYYSLDDGKTYVTSNIFSGLPPKNYTITVKDSENTTITTSATIKQINLPKFELVTKNVLCKGFHTGEITIVPTGENQDSYLYTLNGVSVQQTKKFINLKAGLYTIVAKSADNCTYSESIEITEPTTALTTIITVKNQTIVVDTKGGTGEIKYSISPNLNEFSTNNTFSNLAFGIYQIISRDQNECYTFYDVFVTPPAPLIDGKNEIVAKFKPGQTLADITVDGQNIKWYNTKNVSTGKANKMSKSTETFLPLTTVLVDGTTYYASQTINDFESNERLAVTVQLNTLSNPDFVLTNFKYHPNPVKNVLSIENSSVIDEVTLFSVAGKVILDKKINSLHSNLDLSHVATGIYFLKVKSEGHEKTIKIVKE